MNPVVIIGAGHAAPDAVTTLRRKGWEGPIALVGEEDQLPYQRPPLSKKYFTDEFAEDRLLIKAATVYEKAGVDLFLGRRAMVIDRASRTVTLDNGQKLPYSHLILATGARVRKLRVPGAGLPGIHYLRTKKDVDGIKSDLQPKSSLLVVGAGYIGLEVAASAIKLGSKVTVLEMMDRVLARVTSPIVSDFYERLHRNRGVNLRLSSTLHSFVEETGARYAVLANGDRIAFDQAVIGIGVLPNVELAETAGLPCDNGILVDQYTRTADPLIYAVGDCCNHPSLIYDRRLRLESVPNAVAQAKTAAAAICGTREAYDQVPWFWSDQYDVKLQTAGLSEGYDQAILRGDPANHKFAVFYLQDKRLIAADAVNTPAEFMGSKKLIAAGAVPDPALLADPEVSMKVLLNA